MVFCGMEKEEAQEGEDVRVFGRLVLPCINDGLVVAHEADAQTFPEVAPSEGCRYNGEQFLPLYGPASRK